MQKSRERVERKRKRKRKRQKKQRERRREKKEKNYIEGTVYILHLKEKLLRLLVRAEIRPSQEETTYISGQHKCG